MRWGLVLVFGAGQMGVRLESDIRLGVTLSAQTKMSAICYSQMVSQG